MDCMIDISSQTQNVLGIKGNFVTYDMLLHIEYSFKQFAFLFPTVGQYLCAMWFSVPLLTFTLLHWQD